MRCPFCQNEDTQVKDSRPTEDGAAIRRRRQCDKCGSRFTTFERVQLRDLVVLKRSGRRVPFDRDKLARSLAIALRKRPIEQDQIEQMISGIVRKLESQGESEVPSEMIGEMIMDALAHLDPVAYVRYASVYHRFHDVDSFREEVERLGKRRRSDVAAGQMSLLPQARDPRSKR